MIHRARLFIFILYAILMVFPISCNAQEGKTTAEPKAEKILRQMSNHLNSLGQFSFHSENTIDEMRVYGEKLQFADAVDVYLNRPNRLRANAKGDFRDQQFYYDGKTITIYGKKVNYYATLKAPADIEAALDYAREAINLEAPLAELVYKNSYETITDGVKASAYLGLHYVDGVECHHLAFTRAEIDIQIWVENSKTPFPRKIIITERWVTGAPQFTARLSNWNTTPQLKESLFTFVPPEKARKIDFLPSSGPGQMLKGFEL